MTEADRRECIAGSTFGHNEIFVFIDGVLDRRRATSLDYVKVRAQGKTRISSAIHVCDNLSKRRETTWQIFVDVTRDAISGDICVMGNTHQKMHVLPDECKIALPSQ